MRKILLILSLLLTGFLWIEICYAISCKKINHVPGAEDMAIDHDAGIAYISSQNRRVTPLPQGEIYQYALVERNSTPQKLIRDNPKVFHPHGIYLFKDNNHQKFIYAVNQPEHRAPTIEIFEVNDHQLRHLKTIRHSKITVPNDIFVRAYHQFYITNYSRNNVLYYNHGSVRDAAINISYANGIDGKVKKNELLVVSSGMRTITVFYMDPVTGKLTQKDKYPTGIFGDNLSQDHRGHYWLAGHPNPFMFLLHQRWGEVDSPSVAYKLYQYDQGKRARKVTVFDDNGSLLSGSSVIAPFKGEVLVGSVYEPYFLRCKMPEDAM